MLKKYVTLLSSVTDSLGGQIQSQSRDQFSHFWFQLRTFGLRTALVA